MTEEICHLLALPTSPLAPGWAEWEPPLLTHICTPTLFPHSSLDGEARSVLLQGVPSPESGSIWCVHDTISSPPSFFNSDFCPSHTGAGAVLAFPVDGYREVPLFPQEQKEPPPDSSFPASFLPALSSQPGLLPVHTGHRWGANGCTSLNARCNPPDPALGLRGNGSPRARTASRHRLQTHWSRLRPHNPNSQSMPSRNLQCL